MRFTFMCPHTKLSGGTKVILRLAHHVANAGHSVIVGAYKYSPKQILWYGPKNPPYEIVEVSEPNRYTIPPCDVLINFADGVSFGSMPDVPHILFLQGFGTQDYAKEVANLNFRYDGIIATSAWLAQVARQARHTKIYVVHPGVDDYFVSHHLPTKAVPVVGTLYHESSAKSSDVFMAASHRIIKNFPRTLFLYLSAKTPKDTTQFHKLLSPHSLIINPPQQVLPHIYSSCTVWVSPSINEGFGLPTLEAMACGTPVVSVRNFGLDEYLKNDYNCLLIPPRNKEALADSVIQLLRDSEKRSRLVSNGLQLVKRFTWSKCVNNFIAAVKGIIQ